MRGSAVRMNSHLQVKAESDGKKLSNNHPQIRFSQVFYPTCLQMRPYDHHDLAVEAVIPGTLFPALQVIAPGFYHVFFD